MSASDVALDLNADCAPATPGSGRAPQHLKTRHVAAFAYLETRHYFVGTARLQCVFGSSVARDTPKKIPGEPVQKVV